MDRGGDPQAESSSVSACVRVSSAQLELATNKVNIYIYPTTKYTTENSSSSSSSFHAGTQQAHGKQQAHDTQQTHDTKQQYPHSFSAYKNRAESQKQQDQLSRHRVDTPGTQQTRTAVAEAR